MINFRGDRRMKRVLQLIVVSIGLMLTKCQTVQSPVESNISRKYNPKAALVLSEISDVVYKDEQEFTSKINKFGYFKDNAATVKMFQDKPTNTEAFIIHSKKSIILAFRGSSSVDDWITNLKFCEKCAGVHSGFSKAYYSINYKMIQYWIDTIIPRYKKDKLDIEKIERYYTGHSLGAALATIAILNLETSELKQIGIPTEKTHSSLYIYGSPRVFDKCTANKFDSLFQKSSFRFVNNNDIVTKIPFNGYDHIGTLIYINRKGELKTEEQFINKFIDQFVGGMKSLFDFKIDLTEDHSIGKYKNHLNTEKNPFLSEK